MKFNHSKLRGKIRECGYTQEQLSDAININAATLSAKLNGKFAFTTNEVIAISKALHIPMEEISEYFFYALSSENRTIELLDALYKTCNDED